MKFVLAIACMLIVTTITHLIMLPYTLITWQFSDLQDVIDTFCIDLVDLTSK